MGHTLIASNFEAKQVNARAFNSAKSYFWWQIIPIILSFDFSVDSVEL